MGLSNAQVGAAVSISAAVVVVIIIAMLLMLKGRLPFTFSRSNPPSTESIRVKAQINRRQRLRPAVYKLPNQTFDVGPSMEKGAGPSTAPKISLDLPGASSLMPAEQDITEVQTQLGPYISKIDDPVRRARVAALFASCNETNPALAASKNVSESKTDTAHRSSILAEHGDKSKRSTVDIMHDAARQLAEQRRLRMAAIAERCEQLRRGKSRYRLFPSRLSLGLRLGWRICTGSSEGLLVVPLLSFSR
jgi:hypothetical protein